MAILETPTRNAAADAVVDLVDAGATAGNGTLVFQTATDAAVATLTFSATAFGAATGGVATAASITSDTNATGGTAAQASIFDSDSTKILEATVGTTGAEINLSSTTIGAGDTVSVSSLTVTMPAS
jgi:hypothetical protein